jgi:hypothetical protein
MDLIDPFGRTIRDLRISVTDRCNFRCTYCMPEEGMQWVPRSEVLTFEEFERLGRIFVERFEVDGLRLTGGEPTVRAHLPVLVSKLSQLRVPADSSSPLAGQKPDLAITTNGATFRLVAEELRQAGLDRVNISLDSLDLPSLVLFLLADDLLLRDHIVLVPPEPFDLGRELLHLKLHLLLLELYVVRLLMLHLLEIGQVAHQPVVLVLVELQLLLLRLVRALLLLQLHRVLVHRVPVQELLRARKADETASLTRRVVHRVRTRLVQARTAVQGTAELTR